MRQLIIVAGAIFVLTSFLLLKTTGNTKCHKIYAAQSDLIKIKNALDLFQADTKNFPSTNSGLSELHESSKRYLNYSMIDPWQHPYIYKRDANTPDYVIVFNWQKRH